MIINHTDLQTIPMAISDILSKMFKFHHLENKLCPRTSFSECFARYQRGKASKSFKLRLKSFKWQGNVARNKFKNELPASNSRKECCYLLSSAIFNVTSLRKQANYSHRFITRLENTGMQILQYEPTSKCK